MTEEPKENHWYEMYKLECLKTKELEEKLEGAERARDYWKNSSFDWRRKCTSRRPFRVAVKAQKQLTKAKDIIKELVRVEYADFTNGDYSNELSKVLEQAEQFLKDCEVEK